VATVLIMQRTRFVNVEMTDECFVPYVPVRSCSSDNISRQCWRRCSAAAAADAAIGR